jgi:colicin import membrane protein
MNETSSLSNFQFYLEERGYRFYVRGKNYGVEATHEDGTTKKYRLSTLGVHEEFEAYQELVTRADRAKASEQAHQEGRDTARDDAARDADRAEESARTSGRADAREDAGEKEKERMRERERVRVERAELAAERARAKQEEAEAERKREAQTQKKRPDREAEAQMESARAKNNAIYEDDKKAAHSQSEEDDMKWRDVMGIRETYQEKSKPEPASREEVDAAAQKAKREAIDRLSREFEQMSQKSSQSQSQGQKQGK